MRRRLTLVVVSAAVLEGCATRPAPPPRIDGPSAVVVDSASGGGFGGGQFFVVTRVDGKPVPNSLGDSRSASVNRGPNLQIATVQRPVAAGPRRLDIIGRVAYAAPIQEIVSSLRGRLYGVDGTVTADLQDGHSYRVKGVLDAYRNEVWIEDEATGEVVGQRVVGPLSEDGKKLAAAPVRYTCCNLRRDDDWLGDASEVDVAFVPLGTPVRVLEHRKDRAIAQVGGRSMRIGIDEGAKYHTIAQWVDKVAVVDDPALVLATWSPQVQAAVRAGKVRIGMTRAQVLAALGFPRIDLTPDLQASTWHYAASDERELTLVWDGEGRVESVDAPAAVRAAVVEDL